MDTLHEVRDGAKVIVLAAHIKRHGWQGAPLVVEGEQLLTGTHRYAACKLIEMPDYEIPTIEIADVFAEAGLDFAAAYEENDYGDWYQSMTYTLGTLPETTRAAYGIDIH